VIRKFQVFFCSHILLLLFFSYTLKYGHNVNFFKRILARNSNNIAVFIDVMAMRPFLSAKMISLCIQHPIRFLMADSIWLVFHFLNYLFNTRHKYMILYPVLFSKNQKHNREAA